MFKKSLNPNLSIYINLYTIRVTSSNKDVMSVHVLVNPVNLINPLKVRVYLSIQKQERLYDLTKTSVVTFSDLITCLGAINQNKNIFFC